MSRPTNPGVIPVQWPPSIVRPTPPADPQGVAMRRLAAIIADQLAASFPSKFPPVGSEPFSVASTVQTVNGNTTIATFLDLTSFLGTGSGTIPLGMQALITAFGQNSNSTSLSWSFVVNGSTRLALSSFVGQYGAFSAPIALPGPGLSLFPGDRLTLSVTNTAGGAVNNVQARLDGFKWSQAIAVGR